MGLQLLPGVSVFTANGDSPTFRIEIIHKVVRKLLGPIAISLGPDRVEIARQFGIEELEKLNRKRTRVIVHLVMTLRPVIAPTAAYMERIQMIHIRLDALQRICRAVLSQA